MTAPTKRYREKQRRRALATTGATPPSSAAARKAKKVDKRCRRLIDKAVAGPDTRMSLADLDKVIADRAFQKFNFRRG